MITILIVDDQLLFAQSLQTFITNYAEDMSVVGIANDGSEAVDMVRKSQPDVILMDVYMKRMNGVRATRLIRSEFPKIKILMLSTYDEDENVKQALLAGASGYLLKDISPTELIISIRSLQQGILQISPSIVHTLLQKAYVDEEETARHLKGERLQKLSENLTKREREILMLLATGYENDMIVEQLNISEQTVRNYVSTIYDKLGIKDRFEIIRLANQL